MRHVSQYNIIYVGAFLPDVLVIETPLENLSGRSGHQMGWCVQHVHQ